VVPENAALVSSIFKGMYVDCCSSYGGPRKAPGRTDPWRFGKKKPTLQSGLLGSVDEVEGDGTSSQEGSHGAKEGSRPGTHFEEL
jgi:hypothetical protein